MLTLKICLVFRPLIIIHLEAELSFYNTLLVGVLFMQVLSVIYQYTNMSFHWNVAACYLQRCIFGLADTDTKHGGINSHHELWQLIKIDVWWFTNKLKIKIAWGKFVIAYMLLQ